MSRAEQALADLREVACMPPGVKAPLSQSSAVGALWTIDRLNAELDNAWAGVAEWRALALSLQAQVKRKDVTLEHASAVVRSVQPNLSTTSRAWAQLVEECSYWLSAERAHMAGAAAAALCPSDDFPEDYEA